MVLANIVHLTCCILLVPYFGTGQVGVVVTVYILFEMCPIWISCGLPAIVAGVLAILLSFSRKMHLWNLDLRDYSCDPNLYTQYSLSSFHFIQCCVTAAVETEALNNPGIDEWMNQSCDDLLTTFHLLCAVYSEHFLSLSTINVTLFCCVNVIRACSLILHVGNKYLFIQTLDFPSDSLVTVFMFWS
jgi:hypothetical protein